jgi:hypothetical protein
VGPLGFEGGLRVDIQAFENNHRHFVCLSSAAFFPFFVLSEANWLGDDKLESRSAMPSVRRQRCSHRCRASRGKMLKVPRSWRNCLASGYKVPSMRQYQGLERFETSNVLRRKKTALHLPRVRHSVYRAINSSFFPFLTLRTWRFFS